MPFNGTGIFQRIRNWVNDAANGIYVDATRMDQDTDDIADGLSNCITRDGQSPPTVDLPMGGLKIVNLASGVNSTDAVNYGQVFNAPIFTSPAAAAAAGLNANPLRLATIGDVLAAAYSTALPGQPGGPLSYEIFSLNGAVSWKRSDIFSDTERLAQVQAVALSF